MGRLIDGIEQGLHCTDLGFDAINQVNRFLPCPGASFAVKFLGNPNLYTVESHFFMAHKVFDPSDYGYIFFEVVAPIGPIPSGVQLWYFVFPLPEQMNGDACHFTDFADAEATFGRRTKHIEFPQVISSI